jgi:hypothetical protein
MKAIFIFIRAYRRWESPATCPVGVERAFLGGEAAWE